MDYAELKQLMSKQKDEMTAAERMKAYNAGEEVDYTGARTCDGRYLWVYN